jgi:hypothetical protein
MSFHIQSACEAREFSGRPNYAMARDNDRYRISSVRSAHSSRSTRVAELFRELSVAFRFSKPYGEQGFPHVFLKTSASHIERDRKCLSLSGEVFA